MHLAGQADMQVLRVRIRGSINSTCYPVWLWKSCFVSTPQELICKMRDHSLLSQIFMEHILCDRHCWGPPGFDLEQHSRSHCHRASVPVGEKASNCANHKVTKAISESERVTWQGLTWRKGREWEKPLKGYGLGCVRTKKWTWDVTWRCGDEHSRHRALQLWKPRGGKAQGNGGQCGWGRQVGQKLTGTSTQLQEGSGQAGPVRLHEGCRATHSWRSVMRVKWAPPCSPEWLTLLAQETVPSQISPINFMPSYYASRSQKSSISI